MFFRRPPARDESVAFMGQRGIGLVVNGGDALHYHRMGVMPFCCR